MQILNPTVNIRGIVRPRPRRHSRRQPRAPESLTLLQGWSDLEGVADAELSSRAWTTRSSESITVPKRRTTEDKYGEPVLKKRRDEGKKPATVQAVPQVHEVPAERRRCQGQELSGRRRSVG